MTTINILLVEDDQIDAMDIRRSFDKLNMNYMLHHVKNGIEALNFLHDPAKPKPDITLIDLNMPKMNGLELLKKIREDESTKHYRCYILTTSNEKVDRMSAEKLKITGYIIKPLKLNNPSNMDAFNLMIDFINLKTSE
jgi:CheY-like chemotaxis protein